MGQRLPNGPGVRIDPDQLRAYRRQKKWTQRDLALASGFSEDYISQLERAPATHNKGTKLETITRLAQSLDVLPTDLLFRHATNELQDDFIRQDVLGDTTGSQLSSSDMPSEGLARTTLDMRVDPDRLREVRLRKQWTQHDLALASGFSEDYISKIERAPMTRNKGTRLETILKLSQALEVLPLDLVSHEFIELLYADLTRRELLDSAVRLGTVELFHGHMPLAARYGASQSSQEPIKTLAEYLSEPLPFTGSPLYWLEVEKRGLEIRARFREGGEEWAEVTLRRCAHMRQQAGDARHAQDYIREVEQRYVQETERSNPLIKALIHSQRGWLATEQYGHFEQAYTFFTCALQEALEAGDRETKSTAHHFRLRSLSELAMLEGGAWLGARPTRVLSSQRLQSLHKSLHEDWPVLTHFDTDNPHHYNRQFIVNALIQPQEALREIPNLIRISEQTGSEFVIALTLARWHFSNEEWDLADHLADEALQGYSWIAYPQGMALASALRAKALLQKGLRTKEDCYLDLDLWILALLLHPYTSHPLWHIARIGLDKAAQYVVDLRPSWLHSYYNEVDLRVENKEGVFQVLKYVYGKINTVMPTRYLQSSIVVR
jgi:transcriptional regulator with XRE-family HTH domain